MGREAKRCQLKTARQTTSIPHNQPERTKPTEIENENGTIPPTDSETTESNHKQLEPDQESEDPFWSETDSSIELTDINEIDTEEHEEKQKAIPIKIRKEKRNYASILEHQEEKLIAPQLKMAQNS